MKHTLNDLVLQEIRWKYGRLGNNVRSMQLVFKNGLVSKEFEFQKEEGKEDDYDDDTITSIVKPGPINFIQLNFANHKVFEKV